MYKLFCATFFSYKTSGLSTISSILSLQYIMPSRKWCPLAKRAGWFVQVAPQRGLSLCKLSLSRQGSLLLHRVWKSIVFQCVFAVSKYIFAFITLQMERSFTCKIKTPKRRNPKTLPSGLLHLVSHKLPALVVFCFLHLNPSHCCGGQVLCTTV